MPPVTQALLIANVAVFFLSSMAGGGWIFEWFALWPAEQLGSALPLSLWAAVLLLCWLALLPRPDPRIALRLDA